MQNSPETVADAPEMPPATSALEPIALKAYPFNVGMSPEDFQARIDKIHWIKDTLMKDGVHYGTTPGTKKPSLWQPGAQMLNITFQHAPFYTRSVERMDNGERRDFLINVDCVLVHYPTGTRIGSGMGGGSTAEKRWARASLFDIYNSAVKMAAKRAYVGATVSCVGVSEIFTQDTEDLPREAFSQEPERMALPTRPSAPQPRPTGPAETRQGIVERAWPNDYQGKRYYFAKVNVDNGPEQWQTTNAQVGEELCHLVGSRVAAQVEPSPKPGKFYVKSFVVVEATDPASPPPSVKTHPMPGSDPATKSFVAAEKAMQVVKPLEAEPDQLPMGNGDGKEEKEDTSIVLSDSEKRQVKKFDRMDPELKVHLLTAAKKRNWIRSEVSDLIELDNPEMRTLCLNVAWLRQAVVELRDAAKVAAKAPEPTAEAAPEVPTGA